MPATVLKMKKLAPHEVADLDRAFLQGFARCLAHTYRIQSRPNTVEDVMTFASITLGDFKKAGASVFDIRDIREALKKTKSKQLK